MNFYNQDKKVAGADGPRQTTSTSEDNSPVKVRRNFESSQKQPQQQGLEFYVIQQRICSLESQVIQIARTLDILLQRLRQLGEAASTTTINIR